MDLFVLDADLEPVGVLDAFSKASWTRRLFEFGTLDLTIDGPSPDAPVIAKGQFVYVPSTAHLYRVEQVHRVKAQEDSPEQVNALGRDVGGMFASRIVIPPPGLSHDVQAAVPAETAMKHYADLHGGPGAALARRIPGLVIAPDTGAGPDVSYEARFQAVAEVLADLGRLSGVGWEVVFDLETSVFTFESLPGVDRSGEVFVDVEFETSLALEWLTSDLNRKSWGLVAGQGEGALRATEEVWVDPGEPQGFDRHELFIDANDVADPTALADRGRAKLLETLTEDAFEVTVNPYGSFRFGQDYFLGDLVAIRDRAWGIDSAAQVVGVSEEVSSGGGGVAATTIEIGRLFPTLRSRLRPPDNGSARK